MSSTNDPFFNALHDIERYVETDAKALDELQSYRSGVQFALFAIVASIKLSPGFDTGVLRQFIQTAIDNPPAEFARDPVFQEPLSLLLDLTGPAAVEMS
ncbi:hypothetical protein OVY01_04620 [Robbsia sp. Bb-Pol-6]|uniref:Uncharacterized protein n=1 Tax=Robbsia betulipollinis TaxID=2981849 RepID=A0ABT3ZJ22_9BURK|nr:hypothetical protein [Robbsia betulipollinis]MCY0386531.1 hypothetical protein [Robbsia betulipollinis]